MKRIFPIIFLLFTACSQQVQMVEGPALIPQNQASIEQDEKINKTLDEIDSVLDELGVDIDLSIVPVVVMDIKPAGQCFRTKDKVGIYMVIDTEIVDAPARGEHFESPLFSVLLHEIGHCYFERDHSYGELRADGKVVSVNYEDYTDEFASLDFYFLPTTIMHDKVSFPMPKKLRKYYVSEVVGLESARVPEDLSPHAHVSFLPSKDD